jgi:predicted MFS family arabinose efflux permease
LTEISAQADAIRKPPSLFKDPDFLKAWIAGSLVGVMRWLDVLVVGYYTLVVTGSPFTVSLMLFLRMLPMFVLGAFAGAVSERLDRRIVLVGLLLLMTIMYATLAVLAIREALELWHVAIGVTYSGVFWSFELPVRRTMVGDIAGGERLPRAMGLESASNSITRALGPLVGGLLFDSVGIQGAFGLGASVCFIGALLLATVQRCARSEGVSRGPVLSGLKEGFAYVRQDRVVQSVLVITIILNLFGFACISMFSVIGRESFGLSASETGLLASTEGFGAFCGAILVASFARQSQLARIFAIGAGTYIAAMGVFGFLGVLGESWLIIFAAGFLFIAGFGLSGFGSMQSGLVLARSPPRMRVRVMGVLAMCIGCGPIGILNVGWIAEALGAASAVVIVTSIGFCCYLIANFFYPELRRRLT